ncbi:protein PIGBOS1 [Solea solea]|uniref:protein PIGBOS1 n=1 Tax=Solea solea TaxID=90069 RepID=UPI00272AC89E|nr:protein PIGBOS1 [Solea solea]
MFRRRIPFTQMAFAVLLGVTGGFYIYKPYFESDTKTSAQQNLRSPEKQTTRER